MRAPKFVLLISALSFFTPQAFAAQEASARQRKSQSGRSLEEAGSDDKAPELRVVPLSTNSSFETRPTFTHKTAHWYTENALELGFKPATNVKLSYVQFFNTNLYNPWRRKTIFRNLDFTWQDGYIRVKWDNLWESQDKNTSFSIQNRLYAPTAAGGRGYPSRASQGMIAISRNYFTIKSKLLSFLEADIAFAPSFFIFRKSGYTYEDTNYANPVYEHLITQTTDFKFLRSMLFTIPLVYRQTRTRNFTENAVSNERWLYTLSAVPELDWEINRRHTVGIAFITDNLLKSDGKGLRWNTFFNNGSAQLVWNIRF